MTGMKRWYSSRCPEKSSRRAGPATAGPAVTAQHASRAAADVTRGGPGACATRRELSAYVPLREHYLRGSQDARPGDKRLT